MEQQPKTATDVAALVEFEPISRGALIVRGALAAGALYGAAAAGPLVRRAFAQGGGGGDIEVLNFALTLEYLEATFYERALDQLDLSDEVAGFAETIRDDENAHVDALVGAIEDLGGTPGEAPRVRFPFEDEASFLELAQTLEDTGVSAYNGAAPSIRSKELLATAGTIVQIEARHAARVRLARNQPPAPDSFDPTLSTRQVLKAVEPFVRS